MGFRPPGAWMDNLLDRPSDHRSMIWLARPGLASQTNQVSGQDVTGAYVPSRIKGKNCCSYNIQLWLVVCLAVSMQFVNL